MRLSNSLKVFLEKIIDYAGLFPPAKLSLESALQNYFQYKDSIYQTMLSSFICPISRLNEANGFINTNFGNQSVLKISALGTGRSKDIVIFKKVFANDIKLWKENITGIEGKLDIRTLELRLPDELIQTHDSKIICEYIDSISELIKSEINKQIFIFFEGSMNDDWKDNADSLISGIGMHNLKNSNSGFKLRTGGVTADTFPSSEQISFCIRESLDRRVPVKFTAGLHHPLRHFDKEIGTMMHGFLNVFASGIIAMRHDISDAEMVEILNDENSANFKFTDDDFSWKGWTIGIDDIAFARKNLVLSFGSCSFDEPVEDLKSLNLL